MLADLKATPKMCRSSMIDEIEGRMLMLGHGCCCRGAKHLCNTRSEQL
jgi:hypothetical protein